MAWPNESLAIAKKVAALRVDRALERQGKRQATFLSQTCTRALAPSRIENAFAQPERFRNRFHIFVDVDVIDRALQAHAKRRFQLNPFASPWLRMFVKCFALQGFTGKSSGRAFSPTIIPV